MSVKYCKNQIVTFVCNGETHKNGLIFSTYENNPLFNENTYDLIADKDTENAMIFKQIKESDIVEITG